MESVPMEDVRNSTSLRDQFLNWSRNDTVFGLLRMEDGELSIKKGLLQNLKIYR